MIYTVYIYMGCIWDGMDYKDIHMGVGNLATHGWSIYTTETLKWHLKKHEGWEGDVSFFRRKHGSVSRVSFYGVHIS